MNLSIEGASILFDDCPKKLWGIRLANGTRDDTTTKELIGLLDEYRSYGVNTITTFFMGCRESAYDPFSPDGRQIDDGPRSAHAISRSGVGGSRHGTGGRHFLSERPDRAHESICRRECDPHSDADIRRLRERDHQCGERAQLERLGKAWVLSLPGSRRDHSPM